MKRLILSTFAAVLAVEGSFHLLGVYDWPSRMLGRFPALKLNYSLIFPLLLFAALVFLRKKWPNLPFFALLGAGTAIGLIIGPVAFALGQLIDPLERPRFLNGYQRLDFLQILVLQLFVGIGVTLAWLHGGMAAALASTIEAALRPTATTPPMALGYGLPETQDFGSCNLPEGQTGARPVWGTHSSALKGGKL